jgi:hypothetical protein
MDPLDSAALVVTDILGQAVADQAILVAFSRSAPREPEKSTRRAVLQKALLSPV